MAVIKILSENLINQIAAGEVVERPSSVVKELVENSIDANADQIIIETKNGGKTFIKVTDNGYGMSHEDVQLALQRHATSKIYRESDLWKIKTMGFRGEALPSIASVSKLTIKSKTKKDLAGTEISCDGGEIVNIKDVGMGAGTVVEVYNLFFNTPARQKYLKRDNNELAHIISILNSVCLAHPEISFKFIHNEKVVFDLPKVTDLISRIADIFGKATSDAMVPIFYGGGAFQIDGYVGKPTISRSTSQHQYFIVNNRPIQNFLMAHTVREAYHSMLMEGKKPVFIINIKIDPSLIDVNVHPRKIEIRFEDQQGIMKTIYNCVKTALEKENLIPKGFTESRNFSMGAGNFERMPKSSFSFSDKKNREEFTLESESRDNSREIASQNSSVAITQIANSYIIAENSEGLILIDQHAAHERIRYEQLTDQFEKKQKSIQPLLIPLQIEFSADEYPLIEENLEIFTKLGFEIEPFGGKTFILHSIPSFLTNEDADLVVKGVLDDILNEKTPSFFQGRTDEIIHYMACRSAVKFGQSLGMDEMQVLINQLQKLTRPYTCPHGRPTMISLTLDELEKMFGRK